MDAQALLLLQTQLGLLGGNNELMQQALVQQALQLQPSMDAQLAQLLAAQQQAQQQQLQQAAQQAAAQPAGSNGGDGGNSDGGEPKRKRQNTRWTRDMEDGLDNFMKQAKLIAAQMPELELCQILVSCHGMYPKLGAVTNKWSKVKKGFFSPATKRSQGPEQARLAMTSEEMQRALAVVAARNAEKMRKKQEQEAHLVGPPGGGVGPS